MEQSQPLSLKKLPSIWALLLWRCVAMLAVFLTIPLTIDAMASVYRRDGHQQFGLMIMSWVGGVFAALIYLAIATIAYFVVRKRSRRVRWWAEGLVLGLFIFLLVYENLCDAYHSTGANADYAWQFSLRVSGWSRIAESRAA